MYGAKINREIGKAYKSDKSSEFRQIITNVFKMTKKYQDEWSVFSAFLKSCFDAAPSGRVNVNMTSVKESLGLKQFRALGRDEDNLKRLLTELAQTGAIAQLEMNETRISFRYHSEHVADVLFDTGSPLELYTYFSEADTANDCINGAYIDWDGEIHSSMGDDVLNEIDVFKLNGCIPTFISCKSGRLDGPKAQHALYELETVAERFGGGHARKVLVVTHELGRIYKARAVQMGIEIREV
jgi:hypothetical protein